MSKSGPEIIDPKHLVMGEKWARTFAQTPLSGNELRTVAEAYALFSSRHKTQVIHHHVQGSAVVMARLGKQVHLVENGQLWGFNMDRLSTDPEMSASDLWGAYLEWKRNPTRLEGAMRSSGLMLSSFSRLAHALATEWGQDDLTQSFKAAGLSPCQRLSATAAKTFPERRRMVEGYQLRTPFYLACLGKALRAIREALPHELRHALWSIRQPDGGLAHWALEAPTDLSRRYRIQALRVQPLLLPRLLWKSLLAVPLISDGRVCLFSPVVMGQVEACIDAGRPFFVPLVEQLNLQETTLSVGESEIDASGLTWTEKHARYLAGRRIHSTVILPQLFTRLDEKMAPLLISFARGLSPARQPRSPAHWQKIQRLLHGLCECAPVRTDLEDLVCGRSDAFLSGCPGDWDDPFYHQLDNQMALVNDTLRWLTLGGEPWAQRGERNEAGLLRMRTLKALTLRQLINFSQVAHNIVQRQREAEEARQAQESSESQKIWIQFLEQQHWVGCLPHGSWADGDFRVTELLCGKDTKDEGRRMEHCVGDGGYAQAATMGNCRLFSIREAASGRSISTFELRWDHSKRKATVRQHFGVNDDPPPPSAEKVLKAFMRAKVLDDGPWLANPEAKRLLGILSEHRPTFSMQNEQRAEQMQAELLRRFPRVFTTPIPD